NQTNPTLALDPSTSGVHQRLFVAGLSWHGGNPTPVPSYGLFASFSADGGSTWTSYYTHDSNHYLAQGVDSNPDDSLPAANRTPRAALDSYGNLFLTYLTAYHMWTGSGSIPANGNTLTDNNANWTTNEWAGQTLALDPLSQTPYLIASNTATTLTLAAS